jgi:hypothetical protein
MCIILVPPGSHPIVVKKYIVSYRIISYHIISYTISYHIISYITQVSRNTGCVIPCTLGGTKEQLHCNRQRPERYNLTFWSADLGLMLLSLTNGQPVQIKGITGPSKRIGRKWQTDRFVYSLSVNVKRTIYISSLEPWHSYELYLKFQFLPHWWYRPSLYKEQSINVVQDNNALFVVRIVWNKNALCGQNTD